jgi:hypothetical protein
MLIDRAERAERTELEPTTTGLEARVGNERMLLVYRIRVSLRSIRRSHRPPIISRTQPTRGPTVGRVFLWELPLLNPADNGRTMHSRQPGDIPHPQHFLGTDEPLRGARSRLPLGRTLAAVIGTQPSSR